MSAKDENIATLEAAHAAFRAKIADLNEDAYAERWLGTWALPELLAHMGGWFGEMSAGLERVARGERPVPEGVDYSDADGWNAKFAATASPGKAALAAWDTRFKGYAAAARAVPEDLFGEKDGRLKIGSRLLDGAGIHHFAEHGAELDAWLASRGKA